MISDDIKDGFLPGRLYGHSRQGVRELLQDPEGSRHWIIDLLHMHSCTCAWHKILFFWVSLSSKTDELTYGAELAYVFPHSGSCETFEFLVHSSNECHEVHKRAQKHSRDTLERSSLECKGVRHRAQEVRWTAFNGFFWKQTLSIDSL